MSNTCFLIYWPAKGYGRLIQQPRLAALPKLPPTTFTHAGTYTCKTNSKQAYKGTDRKWGWETDREGENLGSWAVCLHKYRTSYSISSHIQIWTHGLCVSAAAMLSVGIHWHVPLHSNHSDLIPFKQSNLTVIVRQQYTFTLRNFNRFTVCKGGTMHDVS